MKSILTVALFMTLTGVVQAGAIDQIRLTPSEITAKETSGAGAGTSGVAGIQTTVLRAEPALATGAGVRRPVSRSSAIDPDRRRAAQMWA